MAKRRLTERQKERISAIQKKRRQRAGDPSLQQTPQDKPNPNSALGPEQTGTIISHHGTSVILEDQTGNLVRCVVRQNLESLVCGDKVVWQAENDQEKTDQHGIITAIQPRHTFLARPMTNGMIKPVAANLDQIVIMVATQPTPSESLIDRYLISAEIMGIQPIVLVNKMDLLKTDEASALERSMLLYNKIGYPVLFSSIKHEIKLDNITEQLKNKTSILVGQSGVGKSSLIKKLLPEREIRIGKLSEANHGKHTTTTSVLYHLPFGGSLIDSPGVRDFGVWHIDKDKIAQGFIEFSDYLGKCKFRNCSHTEEPKCALKEAVEAGEIDKRRLESYLETIQAMD